MTRKTRALLEAYARAAPGSLALLEARANLARGCGEGWPYIWNDIRAALLTDPLNPNWEQVADIIATWPVED